MIWVASGQEQKSRLSPSRQYFIDRQKNNSQLRLSAVLSLRSIGDSSVLDWLTQALSDPDLSVRGAAAEVLGGLDPKRNISEFRPIVEKLSDLIKNDKKGYVRSRTAYAIAGISQLDGSLEEDRSVISALIKALEDRDWRVRKNAVNSLLY
jgi:HEAT repeat protein